jgi:hypothetical protein
MFVGLILTKHRGPNGLVERRCITLFLRCILLLLQDNFHNHISKIFEDMSLKIEQAKMMIMVMMMIMIIMMIVIMLMMSTMKLAAL